MRLKGSNTLSYSSRYTRAPVFHTPSALDILLPSYPLPTRSLGSSPSSFGAEFSSSMGRTPALQTLLTIDQMSQPICSPLDPLLYVGLADILVHSTGSDYDETWKAARHTIHRRAAGAAEVVCHGVAAVNLLGVGLEDRGAVEVNVGHYQGVGEQGASDFAIIGAVAEELDVLAGRRVGYGGR